jgi:hypothetical protein
VSSKEGMFSKEGGHESKKIFFSVLGRKKFLLWEVILYRSVQSVRFHTVHTAYGFGMEIEAFWARFSRWILDFWWLFLGRTSDYGAQKTRYGGGCTTVRFWHEKRDRFMWDRFGVVRYFPWLEMLFCC